MIKKKNFLEKNNVADMTELLNGEELDMAAEFNNLDNENKGKVQGDFFDWFRPKSSKCWRWQNP